MEIDLTINRETIDDDFQRIANDLLNKWVLKVEDSLYRITEIEFYYKNELYHNDPYIHGHKLQKQKGKWYFHGAGIDLTFGDDEAYGGILIRAIYKIDNNQKECDSKKNYCYGPLNCIQELFSNLSSIHKQEICFCLFPALEGQIDIEKPIRAPRVGLNAKIDEIMHKKFYRFLVMPKQKHADKTGIMEAMKAQGFSPNQYNNIWG